MFKLYASPRTLRHLDQTNDIPIQVDYASDQLASANILDILAHLCAGLLQVLQGFPDVVDVIVAKRTQHALLQAVRIQTDFLFASLEANIIWVFHIRLNPQ